MTVCCSADTSHTGDLATDENWICVSVSLCAQMKLVTAVLSFLLVYHKHKFPHPLWRVHIAMTGWEMLTNKNVFISLMHTILCFSIFDLNKNADNYSIHLKYFNSEI